MMPAVEWWRYTDKIRGDTLGVILEPIASLLIRRLCGWRLGRVLHLVGPRAPAQLRA